MTFSSLFPFFNHGQIQDNSLIIWVNHYIQFQTTNHITILKSINHTSCIQNHVLQNKYVHTITSSNYIHYHTSISQIKTNQQPSTRIITPSSNSQSHEFHEFKPVSIGLNKDNLLASCTKITKNQTFQTKSNLQNFNSKLHITIHHDQIT